MNLLNRALGIPQGKVLRFYAGPDGGALIPTEETAKLMQEYTKLNF